MLRCIDQTATVAIQRSGKHNSATIEELRFVSGTWRDVTIKGQIQFRQFCAGVCEGRTWAGGRGRAIVGAVTRKRPVGDWEH
jgi:hypothetical protein